MGRAITPFGLGLLTAMISAIGLASRAAEQGPSAYQGISEQHPTGAQGIARAGLVGAFDMSTRTDDGQLRDFSPMSHHGKLLGTRTTTGLWGGALTFPRATDRVDLPETSAWAIDGPLSVLVWFRLDALDLHQHIIACDDKFAVWLTNSNLLRFVDTVGDGVMTREPLVAGRWYSVASVFGGTKGTELDSDNIRVFLDGRRVPVDIVGQPSSGPTWSPGRLYDNDACFIGFESHQGEARHQTYRFGGAIDDVLVFARPVTNTEVAIHATRPR